MEKESDGSRIRTDASEETRFRVWRFRPLSHPAFAVVLCGNATFYSSYQHFDDHFWPFTNKKRYLIKPFPLVRHATLTYSVRLPLQRLSKFGDY